MAGVFPIDVEGPESDMLEGVMNILCDFHSEKHPDIRAFDYAMRIMQLVDNYIINGTKGRSEKTTEG